MRYPPNDTTIGVHIDHGRPKSTLRAPIHLHHRSRNRVRAKHDRLDALHRAVYK